MENETLVLPASREKDILRNKLCMNDQLRQSTVSNNVIDTWRKKLKEKEITMAVIQQWLEIFAEYFWFLRCL